MRFWLEAIIAAAALAPLLGYVVPVAIRFIRSTRVTLDLPYALPATLTEGGRVGLLYVRDCTVGDRVGPVRNRVVWLKRGAKTGSWSATVRYPKNSGFVFKCFIDKPAVPFGKAAGVLKRLGYRGVEKAPAPQERIWFLLPGYATDQSGYLNNVILPY